MTNGAIESTLEIFDLQRRSRRVVYRAARHFEAPNWSRDGRPRSPSRAIGRPAIARTSRRGSRAPAWSVSKSLCALELLPDVAQNLVDIALATQGRAVKCVVLDLDNTLWGGVVGDEGLDGIELGDNDETGTFRSFQLYLRELGRRGILLTVCSKNDESVARRVFQEHPGMVLREADIAVFVANWDDKATNIRRIREKLNIGLDSWPWSVAKASPPN